MLNLNVQNVLQILHSASSQVINLGVILDWSLSPPSYMCVTLLCVCVCVLPFPFYLLDLFIKPLKLTLNPILKLYPPFQDGVHSTRNSAANLGYFTLGIVSWLPFDTVCCWSHPRGSQPFLTEVLCCSFICQRQCSSLSSHEEIIFHFHCSVSSHSPSTLRSLLKFTHSDYCLRLLTILMLIYNVYKLPGKQILIQT